MILRSNDGAELEMALRDDSIRPDEGLDEQGTNFLRAGIRVRTPNEDVALATRPMQRREAQLFGEWLDRVARGQNDINRAYADPSMSFEVVGRTEDEVRLRVRIESTADRPGATSPWATAADPANAPEEWPREVELKLDPQRLRGAALEWSREVAAYPTGLQGPGFGDPGAAERPRDRTQ